MAHNKVCKIADYGLSRNVHNRDGEMYEQRTKVRKDVRTKDEGEEGCTKMGQRYTQNFYTHMAN